MDRNPFDVGLLFGGLVGAFTGIWLGLIFCGG